MAAAECRGRAAFWPLYEWTYDKASEKSAILQIPIIDQPINKLVFIIRIDKQLQIFYKPEIIEYILRHNCTT